MGAPDMYGRQKHRGAIGAQVRRMRRGGPTVGRPGFLVRLGNSCRTTALASASSRCTWASLRRARLRCTSVGKNEARAGPNEGQSQSAQAVDRPIGIFAKSRSAESIAGFG